MQRKLRPERYTRAEKRLGVVVARSGDDRTAIAPRQGLWAPRPILIPTTDLRTISARVVQAWQRWEADLVFLDDPEGGVSDLLRREHVTVIPVAADDTADDQRYRDRRTETHFRLQQWLDVGGWLPNRPELLPEFAATYTNDGRRLSLESSGAIAARRGVLPTYVDALAWTFNFVDLPIGPKRVAAIARTDFNPVVGWGA
jgi:hypothetical protein